MRNDGHMQTQAGRDWLGGKVQERRKELRLSKEEAARRARVNVKTWSQVERGEVVRDTTYSGVDQALEWQPGSAEAVLDGNEPAVIERQEVPVTDEVAELARLLDLVRLKFGDIVYDEANKVVERTRVSTESHRRNLA
jgi:transcriptional regulator with XRE-family HTH domain